MDTTNDLTKGDDKLKETKKASIDTSFVEIEDDAGLSKDATATDAPSSEQNNAHIDIDETTGEQSTASASHGQKEDPEKNAQESVTLEAEPFSAENGPQEAVNNEQPDEELVSDVKVEQLQSIILRLQADIDNIRKRHDRELASAHKFGQEKLMRDLLPVLDSFDMGVRSIAETEENKALLEGMHLTNKILLDTLTKHSLVSIEAKGKKFDPEQHEAMTIVPSPDVEANTVIEVIQKGYSLSGRLLRPSRVVVSGKK